MNKLKVGIMGFGRIGRQLYRLALDDDQFEVVAISDIGRPEILHHLLTKTTPCETNIVLDGNFLVSDSGKTRLLPARHPTEMPWDAFGVDLVIDATARFRSSTELAPHLDNGAKRVIVSTLPEDNIDRVVLYGVNNETIEAQDRIVSAGSASTTAAGHALKTIMADHEIEHASMTSVHAYTSDQSLQDYAGPDYRRSRSGAENIIPNATPALYWLPRVLPQLDGKLSAYAMNVPVQVGSMLDLTITFSDPAITVEAINGLFMKAAAGNPDLIQATADPIVSSDVRGLSQSLIVDMDATVKAGTRLIKLIGWHETLGHARRILDVASLYADLNEKEPSSCV